MGPCPHQFPFVHDQDLVCLLHRFQPVGNHQHRLVLGQFRKCRLDLCLVFGVRVGGCLIQDDDRGVFQEDSRNGKALFLTAGEIGVVPAHHCLISLGQCLDNLMDAGVPGRLLHFLRGGFGIPHTDVVFNGICKQHGVLEHIGHQLHQPYRRDLPDVHAANADGAPLGPIEPQQKLGQSGFPTTRRSHQPGDSSLGQMKGYMVYRWDALRIGKLHIRKFHIERGGIFSAILIRFRLAENVVDAADPLHDAARKYHHLHQVLHRLLEAAAHQEKQQDHRQEVQIALRHGDQQQNGREQEQQLRAEKSVVGTHGLGVGPSCPVHHLGKVVEVLFKPPEGAEGAVEHLNDAHAVNILHHRPLHPLLGVVEFHLEGRLVGLF